METDSNMIDREPSGTHASPSGTQVAVPQSTSNVAASHSASTKLTSSDKLTALPTAMSSPLLDRFRNTSLAHGSRHSVERSTSESSGRSTSPVARTPSEASKMVTRPSEDSVQRERGRVSFENDNHSAPNLRRHHTSITARLGLASESNLDIASPPKLAASPDIKISRSRPNSSERSSPTRSASRGASPLRFIPALLQRVHSRDEPFVPVDPFRVHWRLSRRGSHSEDEAVHPADILCFPCQVANQSCGCLHEDSFVRLGHTLTDTIPRQVYLHLLLRLPSLYWSRVCRIFEDAELSKADMHRMVSAARADSSPPVVPRDGPANGHTNATFLGPPQVQSPRPGYGRRVSAREHWSRLLPAPEEWTPPNVSPAMARFKRSWEAFVDSVIREWKTLNIVSALLLTSILTLFQVPNAAGDPATRTPALLSLVCALVSLCLGALYIVRFGTMRSMYKATRWAAAAQRSRTSVAWNVWVLLALPAVWLAWAMLLFLTAIMAFVWRSGGDGDDAHQHPLPHAAMLPIRIVISALLALAGVYLAAVIQTFRAYGSGDSYAAADPASRPMSPIPLQPIPAANQRGPPARTPDIRRESSERGRGRPTRRERPTGPSPGLGLVGIGDAPSAVLVDVEKGDLIPGLGGVSRVP